jgi:hypothetical protein
MSIDQAAFNRRLRVAYDDLDMSIWRLVAMATLLPILAIGFLNVEDVVLSGRKRPA